MEPESAIIVQATKNSKILRRVLNLSAAGLWEESEEVTLTRFQWVRRWEEYITRAETEEELVVSHSTLV